MAIQKLIYLRFARATICWRRSKCLTLDLMRLESSVTFLNAHKTDERQQNSPPIVVVVAVAAASAAAIAAVVVADVADVVRGARRLLSSPLLLLLLLLLLAVDYVSEHVNASANIALLCLQARALFIASAPFTSPTKR